MYVKSLSYISYKLLPAHMKILIVILLNINVERYLGSFSELYT